jgi:hypothetical protein
VRAIGNVRPLPARRSVLMRRPPSPTPGARDRSFAGLAGTIPAIRRVVRFPSGSRRGAKRGSCRSPRRRLRIASRSSVGRAVGSPPRTDLLRESIALPGPAASLSACSGAAEDTFSSSRLARQPDAPPLAVRGCYESRESGSSAAASSPGTGRTGSRN